MKRSNYETLKAWRQRSVAKYQARPRVSSEKRVETPQRARKAEADAEYRRNREQRLVRARGRCELGAPGCTVVATETHHLMKRSTRVDHNVENLRAACHNCNQWVELHPNEATERGWVIRDWQQLERRDS